MPANPIGVLLRHRRAGQDALAWADPGLQAPQSVTVTSVAFGHGEPIPERHRGRMRGPNISPPLAWSAPPEGTRALLLIVQDPDAPTRRAAVHALAGDIDPSARGLPEGALAEPSPIPGLVHGRGPLGRRGYAGPMPIRSHGPHSYVFQLFALDRGLGLEPGFALDRALELMRGHVLARGRLDGTYEIR